MFSCKYLNLSHVWKTITSTVDCLFNMFSYPAHLVWISNVYVQLGLNRSTKLKRWLIVNHIALAPCWISVTFSRESPLKEKNASKIQRLNFIFFINSVINIAPYLLDDGFRLDRNVNFSTGLSFFTTMTSFSKKASFKREWTVERTLSM